MRKALLVITVLFVAAQAYAGTVTLSVNDECVGTDRWASIRYLADANVSAFGLKIYADSGAIITDINDYNIGECTATVQGYGIFPGTIDINEAGVVEADGTPIAPSWDPCSHTGPTGLGEDTIIVEMGALYEEGNEPALSGTLISVKVDKDCTVCVETDAIRGNVVLTDACEASVIYSPNCVFLQIDYDYGDANDLPYPTLWASTGARHFIVNGVYLGPGPQAVSIDAELDGQPNPTATGDDIAGPSVDDEDGVVCPVVLVKGGNTSVAVTASVAGYLNAWLDFDGNGSWAGEQIFTDQPLIAGLNNLQFNVGCGATNGTTFSRWRFTTYDTSGALSYVGEANDGEVEDYNHVITCHVPDVVGDPCDAAIATLTAACFTVNVITTEFNDVVADGNVISTDPPFCTYGGCDDVNMVVSKGSSPDPNIGTCWDIANECRGQYAFDGASAAITGLGGDSDCDGSVNFNDLNALKRAWGETYAGSPHVCDLVTPNVYCCCTDFNHDGVINFTDLNVLKATWGNSGYSPATGEQSCPP